MFNKLMPLLLLLILGLAFQPANAQDNAPPVPPVLADCVDEDGDGYGWSETEQVTCRVGGTFVAVKISWAENPPEENVSHYEVGVRMPDGAAGEYTIQARTTSNDFTTALSNLGVGAGDSFCVAVRALRVEGEAVQEQSSWSEENCVSIPGASGSEVADLTAPGGLSITLIPEGN